MNVDEVRGCIQKIVDGIRRQKGFPTVPLAEQTRFLDGQLGIDSLDLAVVVTELEQTTRKDPFKHGFRNFRTVGELARIYADDLP